MMEKKIVPQVIPGKNTADGKLTEMILAYLITVDIEKLRHITVGSLAEMFGKTQSYISSIFKRDHSISLCQLLNMEKMLRVSKLLKGKTVMSLSKLCSHLRYSRADYFVKVFKKHFYIHPTRYPKKDQISAPESVCVSLLINTHHFNLDYVYLIEKNNRYRLIAEFQNKVLLDRPYTDAKGARISLLKFFRYRNWLQKHTGNCSKSFWTPFYVPEDTAFLEKIESIWDGAFLTSEKEVVKNANEGKISL